MQRVELFTRFWNIQRGEGVHIYAKGSQNSTGQTLQAHVLKEREKK